MLNQGLDPQGLRYAAAGTQYQHAQQNFQALGGRLFGSAAHRVQWRLGIAPCPAAQLFGQLLMFVRFNCLHDAYLHARP